MTLRNVPLERIATALQSDGLSLDLGLYRVRIASRLDELAHAVQRVYGAFDFEAGPSAGFADVVVSLDPLRRRLPIGPPLVGLLVDAEYPFEQVPRGHYLPLLEWGLNYLIGRRCNDRLMLHSGVVARGDRALLMPANSGSGKSTLTAALMCHGYRLLSDEFGSIGLDDGKVMPLLRPICLKNDSIEVVGRKWSEREGAVLGPEFHGTRKGRIAHLAPTDESVRMRQLPARVEFVVFPSYGPGRKAQLVRLDRMSTFLKLSQNAFNYDVLGPKGFAAFARVIESCDIFELRYSDLDEGLALIDALFDAPVATDSPPHAYTAASAVATG